MGLAASCVRSACCIGSDAPADSDAVHSIIAERDWHCRRGAKSLRVGGASPDSIRDSLRSHAVPEIGDIVTL